MKIRFIIPGDINTPTGGYRYDRHLVQEWQKTGMDVEVISLPGNYPLPDEEEKRNARTLLDKATPADINLVDGLAGGGLPDELHCLSKTAPVIALIHHPLCLETGLSQSQATALFESEKQGLENVRAIVTTSETTRKSVAELFDQNPDHILAVEPGVTQNGTAGPHRSGPLRLLSIGSLSRRKGHDVLVRALAQLQDQNWTLDIVGATDFDPPFFREVTELAKKAGLLDKIHFHGAVDEKHLAKLYAQAHIFTLASHYEGYGMVFAEAIVAGLPVVGTCAGAIPKTVPEGCGLLVAPNDKDALSEALEILMSDAERREQMRQATLKRRHIFPRWEESAKKFHNFLRGYL